MKAASQFTISLLALAGLLYQATANATNMAEQPLKASVLAKPTVVFGMDDSGSMDGEIVLNGTDNGFFWGNRTDSSLYPSGALRVGTLSDSNNLAFAYLFPNGVGGIGTGTRMIADTTLRAIPPTAQMAWMRSSDYNPLYYDSNKTYDPWSPAYISGSSVSYSNASSTAAKSHPALGSSTMDLTTNMNSSASGYVFSFAPGMTIPVGATGGTCSSGTVANPIVTAYTVTTTNKYCTAAVSYYPATFWKKQSCTDDGVTCATAWDGSTVKRYEIKSGNTFPSGRTYANEIQNFANWYTYYRKRRLMLAAAMGATLEDITGLRMGVVAFNNNADPTIYDADNSVAANNARAVAGVFYTNERGGGTPTHTTYTYIYNRFNNNTNLVQYACQRNAAFILTDGFANDSFTAPPAYSQSTYGTGTPYQSITSSSLADKGLGFFTAQLRTDLPTGKVPQGPTGTNQDTNTNLHVNTYGLTMGIPGTLWPARTDAFSSPAPSWPTPVSDKPSMVDDLWHATVNGRGQMYMGTDVDSTALGIKSALLDIKSQVGAQSAVAVSTINLLAGDGQAYLASYNPAGWTGDLTANSVNTTTGVISSSSNWSANTLLVARSWSGRVVITSDGSNGGGMGFTSANVGNTVNPDAASYTNAGVIDYLRGNRTGEGTTYRKRTSLIGSVINAEPVVDTDTSTVYLASGEGMLHAFNTTDGAEQWAYVPNAALAPIGTTVDRGYAFKTKLDATPAIGKYSATNKLLVGGLGAAGRSYYALDVTSPKNLTEAQAAAQVKWTFPSPSQTAYAGKVEYTVGRPLIVKSTANGYVVLVTSGYDNGSSLSDGKGRMWMLNANTGAVITEFTTTAGAVGAESGLSQLNAYREDDGTVRYVYGGDLLGNVWKFDLTSGTTTLLAVLKNAAGDTQPVTTAPQLTKISGKAVIIVGTGRLLDITDFGNSSIQSVYAFTDGTYMSNARSSTTALTLNTGTGAITGTVDWSSSRGWRVDLPVGEQVNVDPKFVLGRVFFNTNIAGGSNCSQSSYGYVINVKSGAGTYEVLSTTANVAHPLMVQTGDNLIRENRFNDGTNQTHDKTDITPITSRKNAWRGVIR